MKRLTWLLYLLMCILLLLYSEKAASAAQKAVSLWLTRVLPALLPFYVASTLLVCGGMFEAVARRFPRSLRPLCFLLGAISGYPVGARLCTLAGHSEWSVFCNLCSPAFLLGVVAVGLLGDAAYAWPLMLAHYGAAAVASLIDRLLCAGGHDTVSPAEPATLTLPEIIGDGMLGMLKIGGCIIFFSVCAGVLETALHIHNGLLLAIVTGAMEMTAGCQALSQLALSPRLLCACLSAVVSFGGISVYMQACSTAGALSPLPYLGGKMFQAGLSFLIAFALTPWLCPEAGAAWSVTAESVYGNASAMATLLLAASTGLVFSYLFALVMKKARSHSAAGR